MKKLLLASLLVFISVFALAGDKPHGIVNLKTVDVIIDGKVTEGEYPTHFTDSYTGIGVNWVSDGKLLYVALESPHQGWAAISFGEQKIRGSSMIIAYHDPSGRRVDEHVGSWVSTHKAIEKPKLVDFKTAKTNSGMIVEFSMPLSLSNGQAIVPGQPMPFMLAYHKSKTSFKGRPSRKSAGMLILGKPEQEGQGEQAAPADTTKK
ncbi:hypothetical protein HY768_01760 [candidate division TA06 bacterium]|uniref:DOMON domain-containing protein n=1 Tax=candidate division TA06 bacterium TaxID=2250710 RepID=A0A933ICH2_UNCT6|nr:hypothetical protein [candidate division TA06 bacterium]